MTPPSAPTVAPALPSRAVALDQAVARSGWGAGAFEDEINTEYRLQRLKSVFIYGGILGAPERRDLPPQQTDTSDAAATLEVTISAATKTLTRLHQAGLISSVRHGLWWLDDPVDPFRLPSYLTAPLESSLSLQTALHWHGAIEQIPEVIYAVSLARTQRIATTVATFSIHHIAPALFGGFEQTDGGVFLATVEKALFDFAYLSAGRSRLFTALPETELPASFRRTELKRWLAKIPSARARTITQRKLDQLLGAKSKPY